MERVRLASCTSLRYGGQASETSADLLVPRRPPLHRCYLVTVNNVTPTRMMSPVILSGATVKSCAVLNLVCRPQGVGDGTP